MNYRIKLILPLHVSLDEENVVDRLLDRKGKSSRFRRLRSGGDHYFSNGLVWWKIRFDWRLKWILLFGP